MITSSDNLLARQIDGVFVFTLTRPDMIDPSSIREIGDEIHSCTKDAKQPKVVVDFENVRLLSSAALGMLVALQKALKDEDGALRICNVGDEVACVFRLTRLHELIPILQNTDEAVKSLAAC